MMVVADGNSVQINVTINPQVRLPASTAIQLCQKFNPSKIAKHVPVHTPVNGTGNATNKNTTSILDNIERFLFSTFSDSFWLLILIPSVKKLIIA